MKDFEPSVSNRFRNWIPL